MMNKKLIVIGIAAALAAPIAAQAGVEVYGQARMSVDFTNNNDSAAANSDSAISVSSNASRLGFRGDEDLGNGLTAMWQFEQGMAMDTGSAFTEDRNTFLGLGGGFGTVLLGHHDTPGKIASAPLDIFEDTLADFNSAIVAGDTRADNLIMYTTPDMSGFKVLAAYSPSLTDDTLAQSQLANDQNGFGVAGIYNNGPIYAAAAYESAAKANGTDDATDMKLAGTFDLGQGTKLGALFEQVDDGTDDWSNWILNVAHKMGDTTLKAAYGSHDEMNSATDDAATQFSLGVAQDLTKNTEVYALYSMISNDPGSNRTLAGLSGNATTLGEDASGFSFGINHKFSSK